MLLAIDVFTYKLLNKFLLACWLWEICWEIALSWGAEQEAWVTGLGDRWLSIWPESQGQFSVLLLFQVNGFLAFFLFFLCIWRRLTISFQHPLAKLFGSYLFIDDRGFDHFWNSQKSCFHFLCFLVLSSFDRGGVGGFGGFLWFFFNICL